MVPGWYGRSVDAPEKSGILINKKMLRFIGMAQIFQGVIFILLTDASAQGNRNWHGFELLDTTLNGRDVKIVFPESPNDNRDWIWRARFCEHEPQTDIALLGMVGKGGL